MADTGYLFATSTTASSGTWNSTTNFGATDGAEASCTAAAKNTTSVRILNNFGFTTGVIPDGSVINSVSMRTVWRVTTTGGIGTLGIAVGISGTLVTSIINTLEPTSLSTQTWDITAATTWAAANFRDGTLTMLAKAFTGNNATDPGFRYDSMSLDVLYTPPVTPRVLRLPGNLDGCGSDGIFVGNSID